MQQQDRRRAAGDHLLGDVADQPIARAAGTVRAQDDQVRLQFLGMFDNAQCHVARRHGMDVPLDGKAFGDKPAAGILKVQLRFLHAGEVARSVNPGGRALFDDVEERHRRAE